MTPHLRSMSVGQWLRGVGAALALVGLLALVPLALIRWGDWPITGLPTGRQLRDLPSTVVSDTAVIGVFTVALWVVWALFAVCVAAEVVAEVRGREAGRVRAAGPLQGLAGRLVATVAMTAGSLGPLAGAAAAAPPVRPKAEMTVPAAAVAPVAAPAPRVRAASAPALAVAVAATRSAGAGTAAATGPEVGAGAAVTAAATTPPAPVALGPAPVSVTVGPGDTAWRLAEQHLGDGARWGEIWTLNQGRPQPDGQAWSRPELIRPGWQLTLPAHEAAAPASSAATPAAADRQIVVEPDDNPWSLAEAHLGDGKRWRELYSLNRGRPQPDGAAWIAEGQIRPGWVLALPAVALPPAAEPAPADAPAPAPAPTTGHAAAPEPTALPAPPTTAAHAPAAPTTTAEHTTATTTDPAAREPAPPTTTTTAEDTAATTDPAAREHTAASDQAAAVPTTTPRHAAATTTTTAEHTAAPEHAAASEPTATAPAPPTTAGHTAAPTTTAHAATTAAPEHTAAAPAPPTTAEHAAAPTSAPDVAPAPSAVPSPGPAAAHAHPAPAAGDAGGTSPGGESAAGRGGGRDQAELVGSGDEAAHPLDDDQDMAIRPLVWLGIPAVLAGGVALRLDALRRRRMRTRPRRAPVEAVPEELQPTERRWRAIAERESAEWVDTALRYLTWAVRTTAAPIDVVGVSTGPQGLALLLDGPAAAGAPRFVPDATGWAWTLQCDDLDEIRTLAADEAPYAPGLVTLGTTEDGTTVLVDLERLGLLSVEGDATVVRDWLTGVSLDVATAPWAGDVDLRLVGGLTALAALDQVGTLDADAVTASVAAAVAATDRALGDHPTTQAARAGGGGEPWPPLTIVAAEAGLAPATARAAAPSRGAAVVAAGPVPGATHRLVAGADGCATLYPFGLSVRLSGIDPRTAGDTARLLSAAAAPIVGPAGTAGPAGSAGAAAPAPALFAPVAGRAADVPDDVRVKYASLIRGILAPGEIEVVVLGRPTVTGWQIDPRQRSVEIVCYLAVHDGPVSGDRLRDCIFPPGFKATSLRQAVSRTRTALGRAASGDPHILPAVKDGCYELGPGVRSDAARLQALLTAARTAPDACEVMLLRTALALVRSQPFSEAPAGGYGWASAEGISYAFEHQVTEAAHRLGELAFAAGDARLAEWAARQGQRAVPRHEGLYCDLALAKLHQGDVGGFTRIRREAEAAAAAYDSLDGLQPETEEFFAAALEQHQSLQREAAGD